MESVGIIAGIFTLFTYVPQSIKTIQTKKTRDLSLFTLILLSSSAILWVAYGIGKHLPAVWVTNSIVALLGLIILSIKLKA
jgi:MtN3 and saliva related transmembrane protein